jgi:hypothetical protein
LRTPRPRARCSPPGKQRNSPQLTYALAMGQNGNDWVTVFLNFI